MKLRIKLLMKRDASLFQVPNRSLPEQVGVILHNLGRCLHEEGRSLEAEEYVDRALKIKISALGPDDAKVNPSHTIHS